MSENNRIIKVHIFGEDYPIKGDFEDEAQAEEYRELVLDIAKYVDQRMHDVAEKSSNRSPKNIAVLTALNITDELLRLRRENEELKSSVNQRAGHLASRLEERLSSSPSG